MDAGLGWACFSSTLPIRKAASRGWYVELTSLFSCSFAGSEIFICSHVTHSNLKWFNETIWGRLRFRGHHGSTWYVARVMNKYESTNKLNQTRWTFCGWIQFKISRFYYCHYNTGFEYLSAWTTLEKRVWESKEGKYYFGEKVFNSV